MAAISKKVILPMALGSYVNITEPKAIGKGKPKFSISLLWPEENHEEVLKELIQAIEEVAVLAYGPDAAKRVRVGKAIKNPLHIGNDEKPDDEIYKDMVFVNANSPRRPGVVNRRKEPISIEDFDTEAYSGCYFIASVTVFPFPKEGEDKEPIQPGIGIGLNNLMVRKRGERIGGGASAEKDFAEIPEAGDEDDEEDLIG